MTAYDDLDAPETMQADAAAVDRRLPLVEPRLDYVDLYTTYPRDLPKREIEVTEAAQRIAGAVFD